MPDGACHRAALRADPVAAPKDEDCLVVRSYTTTLSRFAARVMPV